MFFLKKSMKHYFNIQTFKLKRKLAEIENTH